MRNKSDLEPLAQRMRAIPLSFRKLSSYDPLLRPHRLATTPGFRASAGELPDGVHQLSRGLDLGQVPGLA